MSYRYLEIVEKSDDSVIKRIDVTDYSDGRIERIQRGMEINLNHELYFTNDNMTTNKLQIL